MTEVAGMAEVGRWLVQQAFERGECVLGAPARATTRRSCIPRRSLVMVSARAAASHAMSWPPPTF